MTVAAAIATARLSGGRYLKLAAGLREFPPELFSLADTLETLDLSGNGLDTLPDDFHRFHRLRILFCSQNRFTTLPEVLGRCAALEMIGFKSNQIDTVPAAALPDRLRWLILTDNRIDALPEQLGHCHRLQKLMLAGNRLTRLPDTLGQCERLELLRVSANRLSALPAALLALPRLSWLAFAGNPLNAAEEQAALTRQDCQRISWPELELGEALGEGASGIIYRARHRQQLLAVKLFKGAMTSDGLPHLEMAACIAAGEHPGLPGVHGILCDHPQATAGLVMPLIPPEFSVLAGPPSFVSCTRDVYPDDCRFEPSVALRVLGDIAKVAAWLHEQGILHGDLYGHNILVNRQGQALLSDFGAATLLPANDAATSRALKALEVRAFSCLLEEMITRTRLPDPVQEALDTLLETCRDPPPSRRPAMHDVARQLAGILGSLH